MFIKYAALLVSYIIDYIARMRPDHYVGLSSTRAATVHAQIIDNMSQHPDHAFIDDGINGGERM